MGLVLKESEKIFRFWGIYFLSSTTTHIIESWDFNLLIII